LFYVLWCEGVRSHGTAFLDSCELPCGCWELNSGPLEEQSVLLTAEPSLQPLERFYNAECLVKNLSQGYEKLNDRLTSTEGNVYSLKVCTKDEMMSVMDKLRDLESSTRTLEQNTEHEMQTFQKMMIHRFEKLEELVNLGSQDQGMTEQILDSSIQKTPRINFPGAFLILAPENLTNSKAQKVAKQALWEPVPMHDLKEIKQAVMTYSLHSSYVNEILKTWSSCNKLTPFDSQRMANVVL
ncbi:E3 ubiquitin-protein ligase NEDD4, partial [Lemmus lemmus]